MDELDPCPLIRQSTNCYDCSGIINPLNRLEKLQPTTNKKVLVVGSQDEEFMKYVNLVAQKDREIVDLKIKLEKLQPRTNGVRCKCGEGLIFCCPACGDVSEDFVNVKLPTLDREGLIEELVDTLKELADLMDAIHNHEYTPDCFTTQPARTILAKADAIFGKE